MRTMLLLAGGLGVAVALAGCTSGPSGPAKPARLSPAIGANPLDMSKAAARPCTMLRPDQLAQFHLTSPGTTTSIASGPACAWTPTVSGLPSYLAGVDLHSGGLEALYHRRASLPVFQPTKVSEYPAVHTATTTSALHHGQCTTQVGVANDTLLIVSVTVPSSQPLDYTDPCPSADDLAAAILANTEGAAP
ncbi:MAG TPA: DUF3558 domain-containing protein [Pseudonocardiaceae bacterium]